MIGPVRPFRGFMGALALPKSARLSRRAEFDAVRRDGRPCHGRLMVLAALRTRDEGPCRFGVVTSRKVGKAVDRTRLRRRLREIFRTHRSLLPAGLWMVVVPRRAAVATTFVKLADEWRALAARSGYLKA